MTRQGAIKTIRRSAIIDHRSAIQTNRQSTRVDTPARPLRSKEDAGPRPNQPAEITQATSSGFTSEIGQTSWSYVSGRSDGWWIGLGTPSQVTNPTGGTLGTYDPNSSYFLLVYYQQPHPTAVSSPSGGSVVATTTPTLTAPRVVDNSDSTVYYSFRVSASPDGTGTVLDSGWLDGGVSPGDPVTWRAYPGSLRDGVTYYAKVLTSIVPVYAGDPIFNGNLKPSSSPTISFTVRERLGDGGPSPTDTVGSPPAGSTVPSKGAPSPGIPAASETVNLVTGNLALTLDTPSMQTLSGPAGVALSYNSMQSSVSRGGNYGLTGQYYADSGTHSFTGPVVGQRTDAAINAVWKGGRDHTPVSGLGIAGTNDAPFAVRWTGILALPAGTWQLGGSTTGGMRVYLNGSATPTYDDWAGNASATSPSYGLVTVNGLQTYQIKVEGWVNGTSGETDTVQLWAKNTAITDPNTPSQWVVPSGWLTPVANGVPPGWNLLANPASVQWVHADDEGNQVILQSVSGDTASFTRTASGYYRSQPGNNDHLTIDGNGMLQLATSDNQLYTFNADGSLASMTDAGDDRHPAALEYTYSGTPALLRTITDPVSARSIGLFYGGDAACPATDPAPAGVLCKISYWDATETVFGYNSNGQIGSVTYQMGQTVMLAYDSDNRLADIRDALATSYLAAGGQAGTAVGCAAGTTGLSVTSTDTQICYDSSGRVAKVIQPAPTPGAARPARSYMYASDHTDMAIAGFSPASGYASRTAYDAQGRIIQQSDSAGRITTTVWANATAPGNDCANACGTDQPVVTATPAGTQTSKMYDANGNVTDIYGPAPLACFSGGWPTGATPTAPVQGYLPVGNPQSTSGCGIPTIPHTHNGYDEGLVGLAASFWSNGQAAGPATMHTNGPGGTQPVSLCGATTGRLCAHWAAGAPPVDSDPSGHWSLRLAGTITLASSDNYTLGVTSNQAITVALDGTPQVHDGPDVSGFVAGQTRTTSAGSAPQFVAGIHSFQVDFEGSAAQLNEFAVTLTPASGSGGVIPDTLLGPGYRLKTSVTDPDGVATVTSYADSTIGPQYGLATSSTVGAGSGTALTDSTTYEAPSSSTYLRKTSHTLPAGNASTYTYYTGTGGPLAAACGVASNTPQGGQLMSQIDPAPAVGTAARVQQFIYDAAGHRAGRRVGTTASISSVSWECTNYDAIGRTTSHSWPAFNGASARTVTYTYSLAGNPLNSSVGDSTGTITTTVDLLGRLVTYTDTAGKTSTVTYNQAGQTTSTTGPQGAITNTYDPDNGTLATVTANGTLLATTHYDTSTGRLAEVTYANGTTGTIGYDSLGTKTSLVFTATASGALVAGDQTTLSPGRRTSSELEDINGTTLTNPNPAGPTSTTYTYDGAGRLITAYLPGASATYGYGTNPTSDNCANPGQGANTNRTSVTTTPTGGSASSIHYCYNQADQITSSLSSLGTNSQYSYDTHSNQTNDHGTVMTWDAADRIASATPSGVSATSYTYDALDRVVAHTASGTTVRYAYAAYNDTPIATLDATANVIQQLVSLPGGVIATIQTGGTIWSYPDLHNNITVTTNNTGSPLNSPVTYDPWGQPIPGSAALANAAGGNILSAFGADSKLTDTASGITVLGARAYQASEARFLSIDPLEGGCANNYVYVFGDPFSKQDLTGQGCSGFEHVSFALGVNAGTESSGLLAEHAAKLFAAGGGASTAAGVLLSLIDGAFIAITVFFVVKWVAKCG